VKIHTLLDLAGNIPTCIWITDGKVSDVSILDELIPEQGAFYIMDRGYVDFARCTSTGLICDQETQVRLVFLTNNFVLPAITIAKLYKCRWQVELFFKWIKQHLRIKAFYGTSENTVKTQIWIAISVYVLIAIIKKELRLELSLYTILQILSVTLLEKEPILQTLTKYSRTKTTEVHYNQLFLFD